MFLKIYTHVNDLCTYIKILLAIAIAMHHKRKTPQTKRLMSLRKTAQHRKNKKENARESCSDASKRSYVYVKLYVYVQIYTYREYIHIYIYKPMYIYLYVYISIHIYT